MKPSAPLKIPSTSPDREAYLAAVGAQLTLDQAAQISEFVNRPFHVVLAVTPPMTVGRIITFRFADEKYNRVVTISDVTGGKIAAGGVLIANERHKYQFSAEGRIVPA